ncbi:MAG: hypothetical protein WCT50_01575 [Patescibacteria group bacterium]
MNIVINTSGIDRFLALQPEQMFWAFIANFGWIVIGIFFIYGVLQVYLFWVRQKWAATHKNILLAIDIPKGNEQSPKAVENMFTYLAGAHGSINFFEKWFEGNFQKSFSYEVASLEGYTQFLIRTPAEYRNLVESSVYSQYPDAEISEVDDYTENVPQRYPDEEYDVWGTEFMQSSSWVYPIKIYKDFEHQMGPSETQFKDPMAALMDLCGSLRQGEQLWFQMIVIPMGFDWIKDSESEINKILGRKVKPKKDLVMKGIEALGEASELVYSIWGDVESKDKEERPKTMMDLNPLEKRRIEGVHEKLSKLSFEAKIRFVYVAKKDVMNKAKVANGIVGYMKQFASLDLNNLKPDVKKTMTKTVYFAQESRLTVKKNKIFHAYTLRSDGRGISPGIYNIEELATIWHFPVEANVKASMVQKAPGRKADAPSSLPLASDLVAPTESFFKTGIFTSNQNIDNKKERVNETLDDNNFAPPDNLPFV